MKNLILSAKTYYSIQTTTLESYVEEVEYANFYYNMHRLPVYLEEPLRLIMERHELYITEEEEKLLDIYDENLGAYAENEWFIPNKDDTHIRLQVQRAMFRTLNNISQYDVQTFDNLHLAYKDAFISEHIELLYKFLQDNISISPYIDLLWIKEEVIPAILFTALAEYISEELDFDIDYSQTEIEIVVLDNLHTSIKTYIAENSNAIDFTLPIEDIVKELASHIDEDLTFTNKA